MERTSRRQPVASDRKSASSKTLLRKPSQHYSFYSKIAKPAFRILFYLLVLLFARMVYIAARVDLHAHLPFMAPHTRAIITAGRERPDYFAQSPKLLWEEVLFQPTAPKWNEQGLGLRFSAIEELLLDLTHASGGSDVEIEMLMEEHIVSGRALLNKIMGLRVDVLDMLQFESGLVSDQLADKGMEPSKKLANKEMLDYHQRVTAHIPEVQALEKNATVILNLIQEYLEHYNKIFSVYPPKAQAVRLQITKQLAWILLGSSTSKIQGLGKKLRFLEAAPYALSGLHTFLASTVANLQKFQASLVEVKNALEGKDLVIGKLSGPKELRVKTLQERYRKIIWASRVAMARGNEIRILK